MPQEQEAKVAGRTPAPSLADQYVLDDEQVEQLTREVGSGVAPPSPSAAPPPAGQTPAEEPARPTPPRDPETGRFVAPTESPPVPVHSRIMMRRARDLGLTDEDLREHTPEGLEELVFHLERNASQNAFARERERQAVPAWQEETGSVEPDRGEPPPAPLALDEDDFYRPGEFDPRLTGVIRKLEGRIAKLEKLEQRLQAFEQRETIRENESGSRFLDRLFAGLAEQYPHLLSKKTVNQLAKGDPELQRRQMAIMATGCQSFRDPTFVPKLRAALAVMAGGAPPRRPEPPPEPEEGPTPEQWRNGAIARPTHRSPPPEPHGVERATRAVSEQLQEMGAPTSPQYDQDILDGFPD